MKASTGSRAAERSRPRPAEPRPIRVLHIVQNLNYGGMERLLSDLIRHTDGERFETHLLVLEYAGRFAEGLERFADIHLGAPLPWYSLLWPGSLIDQIRGIAPDVVHLHSGVWYKGSLAARRAGVPRLIYTEHGRQKPNSWKTRIFEEASARRTDVVVAVSDALASELAVILPRHAAKIRVVLNGVDTQAFRPHAGSGTLRGQLGIPAAAAVLGSIGRLERIKGYDVMIDAFSELLRSWSGAEPPYLVIAGDGAERSRLEVAIRERELAGSVFLLGWRDDVHELHAAFSLFTMASRSEGTSVSLLESMSAGLCPVVTDVGGNSAVLGSELAHRLVTPESPAALAAAWQRALENETERLRDCRAARERVLTAFALRTTVELYQRLYQSPTDAAPPTVAAQSAGE